MRRAQLCRKSGLKKGLWSPEEDRKLTAYINRYGIWNWGEMPKPAGLLRSGKSCRLRWMNYLRPDIKRGNFTREDNETILKMHKMLGNKWSAIAAALPGRTDNEIKNHWHTHLKKWLWTQPQESIGEAKYRKNLPELNLLVPNNAPEPSSPNRTGTSGGVKENQNIEANLGSESETFEEYIRLWEEQPLTLENLNMGNLQEMFVGPRFEIPHCELMSPCGFHNDFWFNLPVPGIHF